MSLTPTYTPGKRCFVACPPDRCTCMPPRMSIADNLDRFFDSLTPEQRELWRRATEQPWRPLPLPLPFDDGMCDACRRGGVCGCVRPDRQVTC